MGETNDLVVQIQSLKYNNQRTKDKVNIKLFTLTLKSQFIFNTIN